MSITLFLTRRWISLHRGILLQFFFVRSFHQLCFVRQVLFLRFLDWMNTIGGHQAWLWAVEMISACWKLWLATVTLQFNRAANMFPHRVRSHWTVFKNVFFNLVLLQPSSIAWSTQHRNHCLVVHRINPTRIHHWFGMVTEHEQHKGLMHYRVEGVINFALNWSFFIQPGFHYLPPRTPLHLIRRAGPSDKIMIP